MPKNDLYLHYHASAESHYTDITLQRGILTYTYFEDTANRCQNWFQSRPCWSEADLKTVSSTLPQPDMDTLAALVRESGILELGDAKPWGGATKGQRYYKQQLDIKTRSAEKHLSYQSFPQADEKPESFASVETALLEYARDLLSTQGGAP